MTNEVFVLKEGYSRVDELGQFRADCTISLVKHRHGNIIIDTGLPQDKDTIISELKRCGLSTEDINVVVATHGHSDHVGNLNLFQNPDCLFIVGCDISKSDVYLSNNLKNEAGEYKLIDDITIISTAGHTCSDISVLVNNTKLGCVGIAGDLFECFEDFKDETLWKDNSFKPDLQLKNRKKLLRMCDYIIPGHGPMFKVDDAMRNC